MAQAKGFTAIFGWVKQSAIETPILCATGHGVVMGPGGESIESAAEDIADDTLEGRGQELESERGNETHSGDLPDVPVIFDLIHRMLAFPMGTAGVPEQVLTVEAGTNDKLDFTEGTTGAAVATITAGVYSRDELATEIQTQMNSAATDNTYTVTFAAGTDKFTITRDTGTDTIDLNWNTGPNTATSIGTTIGFDTASDDTGATTYEGDNVVTPGAYRHVLKPILTIDDLFGTFIAGYTDIGVKEWFGVKFNGFTLNLPNTERWNVTFPAIAHGANFDDSGPNKISTLSGITRPGTRKAALFRHTKFWMNAQSGAALTSGDAKNISSMNIGVNRNLTTDDFTLLYGDRIDEPTEDDKFMVADTTFEFSKLGANLNDLVTALARTPQKAKIHTPTAPVIAGETLTRYAFNVYLPSVQFSASAPTSGAGRVPKTLNARATSVESIPTGFPTGYTDAITIEIVNTDSADPLA